MTNRHQTLWVSISAILFLVVMFLLVFPDSEIRSMYRSFWHWTMFSYSTLQNPFFDGQEVPGCLSEWPALCKFVDPLPLPATINVSSGSLVVIGAFKIRQKLHRDLLPTDLYGYGTSPETATFPGPTLEALRGQQSSILWLNNITDFSYPLTMDPINAMKNPASSGIPLVPHVHGAETSSLWDGHPDAWWTASGEVGSMYGGQLFHYPNAQFPCTLWYHDHTVAVTRLAVYLGLAGFYLIRDPWGIEEGSTLPTGIRDIPLVVQDKAVRVDGTLGFLESGEYGNLVLVNGKAWPFFRTERMPIRLRWLNGCLGRYINITFQAVNTPPTLRRTVNLPPGEQMTFYQIAGEQGYLASPVPMKWLQLGPGERAEVILDFSQLSTAESWVYVRDHFQAPELPGNELLMRFDLGPVLERISGDSLVEQNSTSGFSAPLAEIPSKAAALAQSFDENLKNSSSPLWVRRRERWLQLKPQSFEPGAPTLLGGHLWTDPPSECPRQGGTELWHIVNLSGGPHPMHLHLTAHKVLWRQKVNVAAIFNGSCSFPIVPLVANNTLPSCLLGKRQKPLPGERGWEDTTDCRPGEVTTILFRLTAQDGTPYPFDPSTGPGYLWHCHNLYHEDNDMMRPLMVLRPNDTSALCHNTVVSQ